MKILLILFILSNCMFAQSYSYGVSSGNNSFIYGNDHSIKNKKKAVFLKDGIYIVHIYGNRSKKKKDDDEDDEDGLSFFKNERIHVKNGKGLHLFRFGSSYQRLLIERRYVDGKFIITADNLRNDSIDEIKKSSLSKEEKDELIEEIDFTDFEKKAEQLSYMVNIIKDHIAKDKLIRL